MATDPPSLPPRRITSRDASTLITGARDVADQVWKPGALLDNRHSVLEVRGGRNVSGMGVVYIVSDGERRLAVKTFQRRFAQELPFVQRFIREAYTWMLLGFHPNIVRAYHLDIIQAVPYLFLEFVPSDNLGRHALSDLLAYGEFPLEKALDVSVQFCAGMAHATAAAPGIVHRDIKPENILITPEGVVKVTDFGLVRCRDSEERSLQNFVRTRDEGGAYTHITQVGSIFGTPAYMAPEQFDGAATVTTAADIYAFGCCLYEMLTGHAPFLSNAKSTVERIVHLKRQHLNDAPRSLCALRPECPPELEAVVMRCLHKEHTARWASFTELQEALAALMHGLDFHARALPHPDPSPREVAAQARSLSLLDGYETAIRLRNLREQQDERPYAFHLALGAYFLCHEDPDEERRQLEKALQAREEETGYEAVRRLAERLLDDGQDETAEALLEAHLAAHPGELDRLLEPHVRMLCARGRLAEAWQDAIIVPGFRGSLLQAMVLRAKADRGALAALLETMLGDTLSRLTEKLAGIRPGARVGWQSAEDVHTLCDVLPALEVAFDRDRLLASEHAVWPELDAYPDLAPDMAWLSDLLGELGALQAHTGACATRAGLAERLGYPMRLPQHLKREECWFWQQLPRESHA